MYISFCRIPYTALAVLPLQRLEVIRPGVPPRKRPLEDFLRWIDAERDAGRTTSCLAKYVSDMRGLLEYA